MKVSMNGLRQNLSEAIGDLQAEIRRTIENNEIDEEELKEKMDDVISQSNILNLISDKNDIADFDALSEEWENIQFWREEQESE